MVAKKIVMARRNRPYKDETLETTSEDIIAPILENVRALAIGKAGSRLNVPRISNGSKAKINELLCMSEKG